MTEEMQTSNGSNNHPASVANDVMISIKNMETRFGDVVIHENLELEVKRGQIVSLVGGSGTGKTTLLRQMLGLLHPYKGTILIQGAAPDDAQLRRLAAARIGMLFQQGALFSTFSVLENIAFPLMEYGVLPREMALQNAAIKLQMVGLKMADAWKRPADLSGGMIKRVALARALIMDPPLLFLDEPTAGLDPEASEDFVQLISAMHKEMALTVLMVTHDLDTIFEASTHVAVLAEKRVLVMDTPEKVIKVDHPFINTFFNGQRGRRAQGALKIKAASNLDHKQGVM